MTRPWWKEAVVYQIYPRSFMDSDGDGVGDLKGIIARLDYLRLLGVDVLWLSPIYASPNDDNGYDISDYREIMPEFGTMDDFEELLTGAHQRGMKIVMDLVVNHTSDEHPWFIESRSSKDNPYRDYYVWHDQPNHWTSHFSGSAWEYDETTEQYYLHLFSRKQPDLNWENQDVRNEVYDLMQFWLQKGIDGFRMDVINFISKSFSNADDSSSHHLAPFEDYYLNGPRVHEFLQEMNQQVLSKYDIMTVGETPGVTPQEAALYTGEDRDELNMVFQFEHMGLDSGPNGKWDLKPWMLADLKAVMTTWQKGLHGRGWNSLYLNNHDQPRMVSRFGNDQEYHGESAKMLATFLHMMQGTPYVYQGEEIGMTNVKFATIDQYRDIEILNMWKEKVIDGKQDPSEAMQAIHTKGRDNARTPMQWAASANAGFTRGEPWLGVNPNYLEINVEQSLADSNSIFHYYQHLIQLRKEYDVIVEGDYELILADHPEIYAYTRKWQSQTLLVILNFFSGTPVFTLPPYLRDKARQRLISNYDVDDEEPLTTFTLRPYEARVYLFS